MALKTFVKVSNISNLSDARYCAGMGVEMLGFAVEESSENYVSPLAYQEMIGWISGVEFVAEFTNAGLAEINEILEQYPTHALQTENEAVLEKLLKNKQSQEIDSLPIKILFRANNIQKIQQIAQKYASVVSFFVLAEAKNCIREKIEVLAANHPVLLEGLSNFQEVETFLQNTAIKGLVLQGTKEIAPGLKDFDELAEILEGLEIE